MSTERQSGLPGTPRGLGNSAGGDPGQVLVRIARLIQDAAGNWGARTPGMGGSRSGRRGTSTLSLGAAPLLLPRREQVGPAGQLDYASLQE